MTVKLEQMTIAEALARFPDAQQVLDQYRMACNGCYLDSLCTVADAARAYDLRPAALAAAIKAAGEVPPQAGT